MIEGGASSEVAQELLRKLMKYEEENTKQKYEKEKLVEDGLKGEQNQIENINMIYSIVVEQFGSIF